MDFDAWLAYGRSRGWCGPPTCATHEGVASTLAEAARWRDGETPCQHVVRVLGPQPPCPA